MANRGGEPGRLLLSTGLPHLTTVFADPVTSCGPADRCISSHPLSEPLPFLSAPSQYPFFKFRLGSLSLERVTVKCVGDLRDFKVLWPGAPAAVLGHAAPERCSAWQE